MTGLARWIGAGVLAVVASAAPAQDRLVVIGASLVEIAYALGAGDRIVGVDQTATYPPETAEAANIGYFRQVPVEGILSLRPDMVIVTEDAGPPEVFELIANAGVDVVIVPEVATPESVPAKITDVGEALGLPDAAAELVQDYDQRLQSVLDLAPLDRSMMFVMAVQGGSPLVAGTETAPDEMFRAAGMANSATFEGYQAVGSEALITMAPEAVIMMPPHAARAGGIDTVMSMPGFQQTPARADDRYGTFEGALLMRFGPRTPEALLQLRDRFGG
ncbi:MAG: ABC transporter substrate-binding protein [Pseudomonadota bacterium]